MRRDDPGRAVEADAVARVGRGARFAQARGADEVAGAAGDEVGGGAALGFVQGPVGQRIQGHGGGFVAAGCRGAHGDLGHLTRGRTVSVADPDPPEARVARLQG